MVLLWVMPKSILAVSGTVVQGCYNKLTVVLANLQITSYSSIKEKGKHTVNVKKGNLDSVEKA